MDVEPQEGNGKLFEDKMKRLMSELSEQQSEGTKFDISITGNLKAADFGGGR